MGNLQRELTVAEELALKAGVMVMGLYENDLEVETKQDHSPLTEADKASNNIIIEGLTNAFPQDDILSEESVDNQERLRNRRVWIIDPLDGTKEFLKRNGEFTINIALAIDGQPVMGVTYLPVLEELYSAERGEGAYLGKNGKKTLIGVSTTNDFRKMVLAKSRSHASPKLKDITEKAGFAKEIPAGSALKGCLIAKGAADVYIRLGPVHEWDICAMHVIVEEAGGMITSLEGKPLKYNKADTLIEGLVVSNGRKHHDLIELISHGQA